MAGQTFAQKILAAKSGVSNVKPGDIVDASPDIVMSHDNTSAIIKFFDEIGIDMAVDPSQLVIILDHTIPAPTEKEAKGHADIRKFINKRKIPHFHDINAGVCHQVLPEKGHALPGTLILGSDSHTTTYGALGAMSAGIGRSETAGIWATGKTWMRVPLTLKLDIKGKLKKGVSAKDVALFVIGKLGADGALYRSVEFTGRLIRSMSIAGRMTLCNMAAEMGAKNAYVEPDDITIEWLAPRATKKYQIVKSDPDAQFEKIISYDVSDLSPQIACPHSVDNVKAVNEVEGTKINQALLGTCTNGRLEDLTIAAEILKGKKIAKSVRLLVFPASMEVYREVMRQSILETLVDAGAVIMNPGCGPCLGAHEGILAPGEVCLSSSNRNFKGRLGCNEAEIYLGSPAAVAASAIEGKIADPRRYL